jgi:hypothetical protein
VNKASLLALERFSIRSLQQKGTKMFFEVDREIELEVLAKSFDIQCELGNSSMTKVLINEFHQFYCSLEGQRFDSKPLNLRLLLIREDQTALEIAQSF